MGNGFAFLRFALVGSLGFAVDGGVMILLMKNGFDVVPSRLMSFLTAVTATWWFNRTWTFPQPKRFDGRQEYVLYLLTQIVGAAVNLGVFFLVLGVFPAARQHPLLPLAVGAVPALAFNFGASRYLVFTRS